MSAEKRRYLALTFEESVAVNMILETGLSEFRQQLKTRSKEQQAFGKAIHHLAKGFRRRLKKLRFS